MVKHKCDTFSSNFRFFSELQDFKNLGFKNKVGNLSAFKKVVSFCPFYSIGQVKYEIKILIYKNVF